MTSDWSVVKLSDICNLVIGRTPKRSESKYWGGDYPWAAIKDMQGKYVNETKEKITQIAISETNSRLILKGTILLSFKLSIGKVSFAGNDLFTNEAIVALPIKNQNQVLSDYLYYALKFIPLSGSNNAAKGLTLNLKSLEKLEIPIPKKFEDQVRIAKVLSKIDELIEKRKSNMLLVKDLKQSIFWEMFGPSALNFEEWPTMKLCELAVDAPRSIRTGPFGSNLLRKEISEQGDVAVLGIDNVVNNKFEWKKSRFISNSKFENLKKYVVYPRDVLVTIMGTTGRSAVIPDKIPLSINTKHLAALTLNESIVDPYYISYCIHSSPLQVRQIEKANRGAIMNGLNLTIIKNIEVKIPPIVLQKRFVEILNRLNLVEYSFEQSLKELQNLFYSTMHMAFSGKYELNNVVDQGSLELDNTLDITDEETVVSKNHLFTVKELKRIIHEYNRKTFNYNDLWEYIEKHSGYENIDYETLKNILFDLLSEDYPIVHQFFNEDRKLIMLEVNT